MQVEPLVNGHGVVHKELYWLVHRGGYSACKLIQPSTDENSRCKVKLEKGGHVLEVDENDLERVSTWMLSTTCGWVVVCNS